MAHQRNDLFRDRGFHRRVNPKVLRVDVSGAGEDVAGGK